MSSPSPERRPTTRTVWIASAAYAAVVALQTEGFWIVLNLVLVLLSARQGFVILSNLFTMARNPEVMEQLGHAKRDKHLLGTLAASAVLYAVAVPLGTPLPAYLATFVVWAGALNLSRPATGTTNKETTGENNAA